MRFNKMSTLRVSAILLILSASLSIVVNQEATRSYYKNKILYGSTCSPVNPCQNGARCRQLTFPLATGVVCDCMKQWHGTKCDRRVNNRQVFFLTGPYQLHGEQVPDSNQDDPISTTSAPSDDDNDDDSFNLNSYDPDDAPRPMGDSTRAPGPNFTVAPHPCIPNPCMNRAVSPLNRHNLLVSICFHLKICLNTSDTYVCMCKKINYGSRCQHFRKLLWQYFK